MYDTINPDHYKINIKGISIDCIDVIEALELNCDLYRASIMQYLWRSGRKPDNTLLQDMQKIRWYCDRCIEKIIKEEESKIPETSVIIDDDFLPF